MGITQSLKLILDRGASAKLVADFRAAGAESAAALKQELLKRQGDLRHDLATGLIDKETFVRKGREVAEAYNAAVVERIRTLQNAGKLTTEEYNKLTKSLVLAGKTSGEQTSLMSKAWGGFKNLVTSLGPTITAALAVRAVIDFVKESIKGAAESEAAWSELGNTLDNNGIKMTQAKREVGALADAIQRSSRFDDESVVRGFNQLLQLTHDYKLSLSALGPIADFAAAKHLTFEAAAEIVGKALAGNTKQLHQYIPEVTKTSDVIKVLGQFHGAAAADLDTFAGGLAHLSNMWGELHEHVGAALLDAIEGKGLFTSLTEVIEDLTTWVDSNRVQVTRWTRALIDGFVATARATGQAIGWLERASDTLERVGQWFDRLAFSLGIGFKTPVRDFLGLIATMEAALGRFISHLPGLGAVGAAIVADAQRAQDAANALTQSIDRQAKAITDSYKYTATIGKATSKELRDVRAGHAQGTVKSETDAAGEVGGAWRGAGAASEKAAAAAAAVHEKAAKQVTVAWGAAWVDSLEGMQGVDAMMLEESTKFLKKTAVVRDESVEEGLQRELYANRKILEDTNATQAAKRTAFERIAAIQEELTGRATVAALHSGKTIRDDATSTAKESSTAWIDSLNLMVNAFQGLGKVTGGIFGGIFNSLSGLTQGVAGLSGAIKSIQGAGGGIAGTIGKLAGGIGVVGSAISIGSTIIGAIGGLFHRDKDPGRLAGNREAFLRAVQHTDQSAMDFLFSKSPKSVGGGGEWATRAAQEDAWEAYQKALQLNVSLQPATADLGTPHRTVAPSLNMQSTGTTGLAGFALGGAVTRTGPAFLHAGETVFSRLATQRLGGQEQLAAMNAALQNGSRGLHGGGDFNVGGISVILNGVHDRDVPRRVVEEISMRLGQQYQRHAALQGNVALPEG